MSKTIMAVMATCIVAIACVFMLIIMYFSYNNAEVRQRNLVVAKQKDNYSQLDNTIKTISQSAQITSAQTEALKNIIVGNAQARSSRGGSLATMVSEAVPNLDSSTVTFRNLQNQVVAARNTWTENQRQLLDLNREHDNMIDVQPSRFFVHTLGGADKIEVKIVTSTRTQESFNSGKDDDVDVFHKDKK